MLIKSFFNLETNSTANLPNEYFAMLQKQEKYKQLTQRVSKINHFQQNLIQCMSTIKITLIELFNEFFKPSQDSFLKKIEHTLLTSFDTINTVCLNLSRKVQSRLNNYQNEIGQLSKKYKEELQQMLHYRKKVQIIRKVYLQTRQDKDKLQRNIDKKKSIESECMNTQKLLRENYENFQTEVEKLLKQCPQQILFQFIEGSFLTHSKLCEVIGQQKPVIRNRLRQCSILSAAMSDISDLEGSDEVSENSDEDNFDQIQIIIEPQSSQTMKNGSEIIQMDYNQYTSDGQNNLRVTNPTRFQSQTAKKLRRSMLRKASIEHKIHNKENHLQKIKKAINGQTQNHFQKRLTVIQLDKAFQKVQSPVSQENRRQKIFTSIKNRYAENSKKIILKKVKNIQKTNQNDKDSFHEKSFVLERQEFSSNHSPNRHKKNGVKVQKRHIKHQQTLHYPPENDNSSESTSKNQQKSNVSLSSIMQGKINGLKVDEEHKKNSPITNSKYLQTEPAQFITKKNSLDQQSKVKRQKDEIISQYFDGPSQSRHHAVSNYQCTISLDLRCQNHQNFQEKKNHYKLKQQEKNKVIEQLFSASALQNIKHRIDNKGISHNKKQMYSTTINNQEIEPKTLFATTFLYPENNACLKTFKNQSIQNANKMQNIQRSRIKSTKEQLNEKKIDFSIFSKIV